MSFTSLLSIVSDALWLYLVAAILIFGLIITVATGFVQIRRFPEMLRLLREDGSDQGLSSFQALMLTLASRVGVGSIAGVATAVSVGGPGALFWLVVACLLGGAVAFIESTLAQIYKTNVNGTICGGLPYIVERGLRSRALGMVVAVSFILVYGFSIPGIQANSIASSFNVAFGISPWISGLTTAALVALIVLGSKEKFHRALGYMVPFMAVGYILLALVVLAIKHEQIPDAALLIWKSAIGTDSVYGGIVGAAIAMGVRRAIFSTAAGLGEGTFGSAAAHVTHPVKQGLVQAFSIYIDALVCLATGVMLVMVGSYNVADGQGGFLRKVLDIEAGSGFTQAAIEAVFPGFGAVFIALSVGLFAITTLLAYSYICEVNVVYLFKGANRRAVLVVKLVMLVMIFSGAVQSAELAWALGDTGLAVLAWINIACMCFLAKHALRALRDYDAQRNKGLNPQFNPEAINLDESAFWSKRSTVATTQVEH